MKKFFVFLSLIFVLLMFFACKKNEGFKNQMDQQDRLLLNRALKANDAVTAIVATQSLLSRDTANIGLYDTLTQLYSRINHMQGVLYASKKIIDFNALDQKALENYASAAKQLGIFNESLATYSKLFEIENNSRYLYEMAVIFFNTKNEVSGEQKLMEVFNSPRSRSDEILIKVTQNQAVKVPVLAAAFNYYGFIHELNKQYDQAASYYKKALELAPNFILAKNNLEGLSKK
jgi:tetratricopeptide (TPR) repeat protein